jgi:hypothetical protein
VTHLRHVRDAALDHIPIEITLSSPHAPPPPSPTHNRAGRANNPRVRMPVRAEQSVNHETEQWRPQRFEAHASFFGLIATSQAAFGTAHPLSFCNIMFLIDKNRVRRLPGWNRGVRFRTNISPIASARPRLADLHFASLRIIRGLTHLY